ncbi:MAG: EAL domain-containing protein [Cyanobacteria bacterium P01_F01_bin.150]
MTPTPNDPIKILVVEDEGIVALDLQSSLMNLNYDVPYIADTGEEAIQLAHNYQLDLVLMDIRLKGKMDGIEAAQIILKTFNIPIIFLTAFADQSTLDRAKTLNPVGYLLKPFDEQDLHVTIEVALHKHISDQVIKAQKDWLQTVLRSIGDGVVATDNQGVVTFMNRVAESLTHWSQADAINQNIADVLPIANQSTQSPLEHPIHQVLQDRAEHRLPPDAVLIAKDQSMIPIDDSAVPIVDERDNVSGAVIVFRDITEQLKVNHQLYKQAYLDTLTELPNRAAFIELIKQSLRRIQAYPDDSFALLFVDLDRFKLVNDSLGHTIGDRLLSLAAQRIKQCLRSTDTVARLGGDEFAILCERTDMTIACQVAERIVQAFCKTFVLGNHELFCSASIGLVQSNHHYQSTEEILRDADIAMYRAKAKGRGCYEVFDTVMHYEVSQCLQMETDLRQAIANQQLTVYYQPIIDLKTQDITGFEALARWNSPDQGVIGPNEFIPIAEETGLIIDIDWWVLQEACRQIHQWQTQFPHYSNLTISANLSSQQFGQSNQMAQIQKILAITKLPAHCLKLELTESVLIKNPKVAINDLNHLKTLGIEFYIDDFGTGYSSLSYLHQYPLDTLKIDQSFIQSLDMQDGKNEIVRAIVMMAHVLGMTVVAEGIETAPQLGAMRALNCEYGQGYFFYPPLSADEAEAVLRSLI